MAIVREVVVSPFLRGDPSDGRVEMDEWIIFGRADNIFIPYSLKRLNIYIVTLNCLTYLNKYY